MQQSLELYWSLWLSSPQPTIMVKIAYGLFGAAAGSIVGETIEAEAVNVKKQIEEMKTYREYMAFKKGPVQAEATS